MSAHDPHRFEFDLDRAISEQVIEALEASPSRGLVPKVGPPSSGVYALFWKGTLVYVGMASKETTSSKRTVAGRLSEHRIKIGKRQNIALSEMACKYLTFDSEWWVFAAEFALIAHYNPAWNRSGFGSKVPGAGRPGTGKISPWNRDFPPR